MARATFQVAATSPTTNTVPGPDGKPETLTGLSVRAVPVAGDEQGRLMGWYANTPNGQIGFTIFGDSSKAYVPGYKFYIDFMPAPPGA